MTGSLLITFREGLEAFLVVGIILSYLARVDMKKYSKWVFLGAGLGLAFAFALALLFQLVYTGYKSAIGELYLKVSIMGFAALVLSYMVVWMSKNSRHIKGNIEKKLDQAISVGGIFSLVLMAFLAILREGFETVLFLGALYGDQMGGEVLTGGIIGLVIAFAVTLTVFRGLKSVPLKFFFKVTGGLIILIAGGLIVNMIGVMQDINILPVIGGHLYDIGWIMEDSSAVGIFFKALFGYTHSPSLMQAVSYCGYLAFFTWLLNRRDIQPVEKGAHV
ncbi:Ferrous iron transport permease EfeU [hydrothermal vent metagenome]|uniref:Ferrous iron transport permease EfeU n=1 Tax=hydrothermal vent metagenome TaxID=652676 RepID=A0A3B1BZW5_9ZZZZ